MPSLSSTLPSPAAISLSHATNTTTTTTTTVTFYTNTLGKKHKLNKPQTVQFPSALLTAQYALSLLPNTALLQSDDLFSAYNNLELDKLRLSADAAIHLTIVRWHLLRAAPTAEARNAMVERQRLVCGCDNPSYLQCRIRAYAALQRRGGKPDVRCTRFQKLPVAVTSSPTLLDLLLDAIEKEPRAELSDLAKRIQASYPEISAIDEIRFNDGTAIEYKVTRMGDTNGAERNTAQQISDSWVKREMLWRIDSNHPHIIAFDKELANEVDFITACPGNVYQVNWKDEEASADKVTHDNLVLLGWTDKVFRGGKAATDLAVGTCVTIDGEVGEIVKVQKGRGARGKAVFDVKVADKMRAKVKPSELKPAVYEVQELVDGLVDTAMDDGVKQSLQRVRMLLRALLPAPPIVAMVRGEEKEPDDAEEDEEEEEQEEDGGRNEEDEKKENNGKDEAKEDDEEEEENETEAVDGKEEKKDVEMEQEKKEETHQAAESKEKENTGVDDDDNVEEPIEEKQESANPSAGASDNGTRKVKQAKRKASSSTATPKSDKRRGAR